MCTFILVDFIFASFNWEGVSKIWYTSSRIVYFFSAINWYYNVEQNYHRVEKSAYSIFHLGSVNAITLSTSRVHIAILDVLVSGISKAWKVHFAKQCRQWESLITIFFIKKKIILCMLNKSSFKLVINIRFSLTPL